MMIRKHDDAKNHTINVSEWLIHFEHIEPIYV